MEIALGKYGQEFLGQEIILNLFHGTSRASSDKIISEKYIRPSAKVDEWLGTGAYFWLNKKYQYDYQKAVIEVFIKVEYECIFDLNNDHWRRLFDKYKSKNPGFNDGVLFDLICDELYESGIAIKVLKATQPFSNFKQRAMKSNGDGSFC